MQNANVNKCDADKLFEEGVDYPLQKADAEADDIQCDDQATLAAQKAFGITYLYPWQRIVIANIMDSACCEENGCESEKDVSENTSGALEQQSDIFCNGRQIVLLPTGAGKSLCFLVPALLLKGPTLVLYPLLALMSDQKRRMDSGGMVSVVFRGQQTAEEREENFIKIKNGARIILANPEVLQNEQLVMRLSKCGISHIAIDEAHCVSEWGDSFRPAYLTLGKIIKQLGVKVVTAFTATASPEVLARVSEVLFDGSAHIVRSDSDRPNIHYTVINTYAKKRTAFKLALTEQKPLIIFCGTRKHAEDMARELTAYYGSDKVKFYHAGLEKEEKTKTEKWFYPKTDAILCCTCAFGMGVDKKDIHCVIHLDCPSTAEAYIQEAGRGGRDGSIAKGILLWSYNDSLKGEEFALGTRGRVLKTFAESATCRRQILLDALGGEQAPCDGCDVCERGGPAPFAEDAGRVLKYIHQNRKLYTEDELYLKLEHEFNKIDLKKFGVNIWEHSDIAEILSQLEKQKLIRTCIWPWYNKIDCAFFMGKKVSEFYSGAFYKKLFLFQERALTVIKKIIFLKKMPERFLQNLFLHLKQRLCLLQKSHLHLKTRPRNFQQALGRPQQLCGTYEPSGAFSYNEQRNEQSQDKQGKAR
ncbi:MAG: RecQ family ATP-dependent DNA helicase [Treponema sp.]